MGKTNQVFTGPDCFSMKVNKDSIRFLTKSETLEIVSRKPENRVYSNFLENVLSYCKTSIDKEEALKIKQALVDVGLTEFEAIQLLDYNPKSFLCLQLIIEEMEERFLEQDLLKILSLFKDRE